MKKDKRHRLQWLEYIIKNKTLSAMDCKIKSTVSYIPLPNNEGVSRRTLHYIICQQYSNHTEKLPVFFCPVVLLNGMDIPQLFCQC